MREFALLVPSTAICELLGVPYGKHEFFEEQTRRVLMATSTAQGASAAATALIRYFDELIDTKRAEPGEGLIDELIADRLAAGELTRQEPSPEPPAPEPSAASAAADAAGGAPA